LAIKAQSNYVNVEFNGNFVNGTTLYSDVYFINGSIYGRDVYPNRSTIQKNPVCENETISFMNKTCVNKTIGYRIINSTNISIIIKSCSWQKVDKNVTICRNVTTPIICKNPFGKYTNQLSLNNFKYSTDNSSWNNITYSKIYINESLVYFKVDIPSVCSPEYYINKAIFIEG
jgi:hypothetical protein